MGIKGNDGGYYFERILLILMHIAFYCAADELGTDFAGSDMKLPAVPQNVTAVQVGKDQVLITWTIPGYHRIRSLSHKVMYAPVENGDQQTEQWKSINVTDSHAVIIGGLTINKTYAIRVSSVNPLGQEPMSQPALITMRVIDDCLYCKPEETTSSVCKCSSGFIEETCKEVCQMWCRDTQGFDATKGCLGGCVIGWYGQHCNISCSDMCQECDQVTGQCVKCLSNVTGPYCNETCEPGFYGVTCELSCPTLCNRCLNHSYCTECKDGRYGESCQKTCHSECLTCVDDPQKCTLCKPGKYLHDGNRCLECPENCKRCSDRDKCLQCKSGKYGHKCDMLCPKNCVICTSSNQCNECVPDRHGEICQCNSNCRHVSGYCDTDEVCQSGCQPYKMGVFCNHSCPANCNKCDQLTGACLVCDSGFYGPKCNQRCGRCKRNKGTLQCDRQTGKCEDCNNGWYGWRCDKSCNTQCKGVSCERVSGHCDLCETGYYGLQCTEKCSQYCLNVNVTGCSKQTGFCDICVDGFFDYRCNGTCNYCGSNPCDKLTGVCQRCPSGFYGEKCKKRCHVNCNASDITKVVCDKDSGYCIHGCKTRWYNELCQSPCSATCLEDRCHQDSGVCLLGCVMGFTGDTCGLNIHKEYLIALDVRQIGAQNVLIQWNKLNLTDIELESVKRVVLNHKMSGIMAVDIHDVLDWNTKTHFLLREVNTNNKHTFQLMVLFELRSQSPIISRPAEFALVPRASDEPMLHLTADVEIYDMQQVQEYSNYGHSRYTTITRCTRVTEENILNPYQYDKIKTQKISCNVYSKGDVVATEISFFMDNSLLRSFVVTDDKLLTWIPSVRCVQNLALFQDTTRPQG
ncbi:hypothetical protein ACJMK2_042354 [Sinanodonta woodiana]|uniref:Fibronectin type-III domain-containing protein n=1 Tax=Sinanodonta woodiana TaxID=1069815 RepID=A0ABD3W721_SINWO